MVKVVNPNRNPAKVGSKVMMEHSLKKPVCRVSKKRIMMMRRRISALLDEKESWESKNQELTDSFNKEKKLSAELQKQVFDWQRLYHEAIISLNTFKVKHTDIMQNISLCLEDTNMSLHDLVELANIMSRNKVTLTSELNSLRSLETENYFERSSGDGGQVNTNLCKEREKRRKHKVGPMVKGVLIQKPTIRLERVMLHQPQVQRPENSNLSPTEANDLTPITEENEQETSIHLGQISMRRRKHRLGSVERWRIRKQEQLEKERERKNQCSSVAEETSDSDNQLGPVIRLQRVSGLLVSPKLLEVGRGQDGEGKGATSRTCEPETHRRTTSDNPLEGCSWMNVNSMHSNKIDAERRKLQSQETSDSSDEESETLNVVQKNMCSMTDTSYKNQTITVCRKSGSISSLARKSQGPFDCSRYEPDSTSNMVLSRPLPKRDSLGTNSSSGSSVSINLQCTKSVYSDATSGVDRSQQERSVDESRTSIDVGSLAISDSASQVQRRSSSFCNSCTAIASPLLEKRIRKKKIHLYPGEEIVKPKTAGAKIKKVKPSTKSTSKVPIRQISSGRKSLGKSSLKRSSEISSATSSTGEARNSSQGKPGRPSQKKKVPKKSSVKTSLETPRNSATAMDQSDFQSQVPGEGRVSRRNRGPVSYKESPLHVKMRRT